MRAIPFRSFAACAALFSASLTAHAADTPAFDTKYIPKDTIAAIVVRPSRVLGAKAVKNVTAAATNVAGPEIANKPFRNLEEEIGTPPSNIAEVVMLFNPVTIRFVSEVVFGLRNEEEQNREQRLSERQRGPAGIFRFHKPVDQKRILKNIFADFNQPKRKRVHAGKTYYVEYGSAACFIEPKTLIVGPETVLKTMITANNSSAPIAKLLLKAKPTDHGIFAMTGDSVASIGKMVQRGNAPAPIAKLFELSTKIESIFATGRLTGKTLVSVQIETADPATATQLAATAKNLLLPMVTGLYKQSVRPNVARHDGGVFLPFAEICDEVLKHVRVDTQNANLAIRIARPRNLDALPKRLKPLFEQAKRRAQRRDNLKRIGLAMHKYHDTHKRLPRHGSDHTGKQHGLSWRVHLLPYLKQGKLYKQFKLDEPWNSAHNKKLVGRMPAVFKHPQVKTAGKTTIHVFTGESTPFGGKKSGTQFRDVTDGLSHTIMAVEGGPDKAAFWTKPGGIVFNVEENPLDELGNIGEVFHILLMDGSVRGIEKSIQQGSLNRLIQHTDGNTVGDD